MLAMFIPVVQLATHLAATAASRLGLNAYALGFRGADSAPTGSCNSGSAGSILVSHDSSKGYKCWTALSRWFLPARSLAARTTPSRSIY